MHRARMPLVFFLAVRVATTTSQKGYVSSRCVSLKKNVEKTCCHILPDDLRIAVSGHAGHTGRTGCCTHKVDRTSGALGLSKAVNISFVFNAKQPQTCFSLAHK